LSFLSRGGGKKILQKTPRSSAGGEFLRLGKGKTSSIPLIPSEYLSLKKKKVFLGKERGGVQKLHPEGIKRGGLS